MKIIYVTVKTPYGKVETFIIPEIKEIIRQGNEVFIAPLRPDNVVFHEEAQPLVKQTISLRVLEIRVLLGLIFLFLRHPLKALKIIFVLINKSRNIKIMFKNLAVVPKGFCLAKMTRKLGIEHIHAHWASTTSTVAYIASFLTGIPWSVTAHRWDIGENNLLEEKVAKASFTRTIDEKGRNEVIEILNNKSLKEKISVIHCGVEIPEDGNLGTATENIFTFICPANIVPVKGHKYLIGACSILHEKGLKFKCIFAGEGVLEDDLKIMVKSLHLNSCINFVGRLPHERLIRMYREGMVNLIVLPSIITEDGEREGIPVALMEAMAYKIPALSTRTGGIPELLNNAGVLVPERNEKELADAIERLILDQEFYSNIRESCRKKVVNEFNVTVNANDVLHNIKNCH